ncbi:MAG: YkgJ family cysteine cluster protein [Terracidiphilus sp.]|jgi:Fe-S-cluster containining protein
MNDQPAPPQETVTVNFAIGLGDDKLSMSATVPAGQTNLTRILPVIQSLDNSLIDGITSQLAQLGRHVSCKAGCGACCRQLVPISIFEAEALAGWIHTLPETVQQALAQRFHQALQSLAASGVLDRLLNMTKEDWIPESETRQRLAIDYLHQRVPCPFLENESCSIHPIRPLICREYLVTSPAEHCFDPATMKVEGVPIPIHFFVALNRLGAQVERESRGWIPLVFLFAWMKAGAHPGEQISGTGPEVLYQFAKSLSEPKPAI